MTKLPDEFLTALRERRNKIDLMKAEVQALEAQLQLDMARALSETGVVLSSAGVCLVCGTVTKNQEKCECCPEM